MKKTLIALAVLGVAGMAQAQSSVTIYGAVDINYKKESGSSVTMDERYNNRLGFMGQEALGGGLYATFQLEHRFQLQAGKDNNGRGDFEGAANVGLKGNFGQVRFGRVNELSTETYRQIDPFQQYGVAGMFESYLRGNDGEGRLSYTARYDSLNYSGFKFGASYTVKNNTDAAMGYPGAPNNGWAVSGTYTNGPVYVVANYNKAVNSTDSYNWNLGGAYAFGPAKLSLGYEQTELEMGLPAQQKNWIVGLAYTVGYGVVNASYNDGRTRADVGPLDLRLKQYALGYTYNLSKRTAVYANYAHLKLDVSGIQDLPISASESKYELGITHKF
jgi:predicted porin